MIPMRPWWCVQVAAGLNLSIVKMRTFAKLEERETGKKWKNELQSIYPEYLVFLLV